MGNPLSLVANELVADGKGIFAADASPKTLTKRALEVGIPLDTVESRLNYRKMTLSIPGLSDYIGGVILHEEALGLIDVPQHILPGVKVDQGTQGKVEKVTLGLEGLVHRLANHAAAGAKFTKWRAVITIGSGIPTGENISQNAEDLANYAKLSQQAGLVPIVEPEVLMDGDHTIDRCYDVTRLVGKIVFGALIRQSVDLSAMLYKPNMVLAGKDCPAQPSDLEIAKRSVDLMLELVPPEVAGIVFLSGGQEAIAATKRLNEIAKLDSNRRWSFSFERAIEGPAMQAWAGKANNVDLAQKILLHRARCNSLASLGRYTMEVENHEI